jgi:hypothetical protein
LRTVGLWRDAGSPDILELSLSPEAQGIVLMLRGEFREEWSADGRTDGGTTSYLRFAGMREITAGSR